MGKLKEELEKKEQFSVSGDDLSKTWGHDIHLKKILWIPQENGSQQMEVSSTWEN